jgi:hypothetical protein
MTIRVGLGLQVDAVKSKGTLLDTIRILCSGIVGGKPITMKKSHADKKRIESRSMEMETLLRKAKDRLITKQGFRYNDVEMSDEMRNMSLSAFSSEEINEGWFCFRLHQLKLTSIIFSCRFEQN